MSFSISTCVLNPDFINCPYFRMLKMNYSRSCESFYNIYNIYYATFISPFQLYMQNFSKFGEEKLKSVYS